jgi:hypothetical protein
MEARGMKKFYLIGTLDADGQPFCKGESFATKKKAEKKAAWGAAAGSGEMFVAEVIEQIKASDIIPIVVPLTADDDAPGVEDQELPEGTKVEGVAEDGSTVPVDIDNPPVVEASATPEAKA